MLQSHFTDLLMFIKAQRVSMLCWCYLAEGVQGDRVDQVLHHHPQHRAGSSHRRVHVRRTESPESRLSPLRQDRRTEVNRGRQTAGNMLTDGNREERTSWFGELSVFSSLWLENWT